MLFKSLKFILKEAAKKLGDIVFPPVCLICKSSTESTGQVCGDCWGKINFIAEPKCQKCSKLFSCDLEREGSCSGCVHNGNAYNKVRSAIAYDDFSKKMIFMFKYSDRPEIHKLFTKWMKAAVFDIISEVDIVTS